MVFSIPALQPHGDCSVLRNQTFLLFLLLPPKDNVRMFELSFSHECDNQLYTVTVVVDSKHCFTKAEFSLFFLTVFLFCIFAFSCCFYFFIMYLLYEQMYSVTSITINQSAVWFCLIFANPAGTEQERVPLRVRTQSSGFEGWAPMFLKWVRMRVFLSTIDGQFGKADRG